MRIEIHIIQNHSPANLNRDDLGAPKTCYFGGVIRSRISSQCLKRSIRLSDQFKELGGAVRTRRLAEMIASTGSKTYPLDSKLRERAEKVLAACGFISKSTSEESGPTKMLVYTSKEAISEMRRVLQDGTKNDEEVAEEIAKLIAERVVVPDIALSGRMLEPGKHKKGYKNVWDGLNKNVEASLQVAHAISTHEAHTEIDYYVAADDIPGSDAGAGYVDETMFTSACFYKYFSINWDQLLINLKDAGEIASNVVDAFIRAAALTNPTGKQNSFAAHNPPAGILIEIRDAPLSYANAFADPVNGGELGVVGQSIAQLAQHVRDMDVGYGEPTARYWFSPNRHYRLQVAEEGAIKSIVAEEQFVPSLDKLIEGVHERRRTLLPKATPKVAQ